VVLGFNALLLLLTILIARDELKEILKKKEHGYFYTPLRLPKPVEIK